MSTSELPDPPPVVELSGRIAPAGVAVHAHADGVTVREAADRLLDRLDRRIARISRTRRGDRRAHPTVANSGPDTARPDDATAVDGSGEGG